jgi:hypothetical protein
MRPLGMGGVGAPSRSLERGRVQYVVVDGEQSLANAVGNFIEVARSQLVGYEPGKTTRLASINRTRARKGVLFQLNNRHCGVTRFQGKTTVCAHMPDLLLVKIMTEPSRAAGQVVVE